MDNFKLQVDPEPEQHSGPDQIEPISRKINSISGLLAKLVCATLALSGCSQLKSTPLHCPLPPQPSSCNKTISKSPERLSDHTLLDIALRLHEIHTKAIDLADELLEYAIVGKRRKDVWMEAQKRRPEIKAELMEYLASIKKFKEKAIKNHDLISRLNSVEKYIYEMLKNFFGN